jgi:hypothetical protein
MYGEIHLNFKSKPRFVILTCSTVTMQRSTEGTCVARKRPQHTRKQQQNYGVFYVVRAATVDMQWRGKHASTVERLCFPRGPCLGVILKTIDATVKFR